MVMIPERSQWGSIFPPDRYRNALMTACGAQVGPVSTPAISLYNNDTLGRYLYVYGFQYAPQAAQQTPLDAYWFKGQVTSSTTVTTVPLKLDEKISAGIVQYGAGAGSSGAVPIATLGSNEANWYNWPNQWPIIILPPGYSFATSSHQSSEIFSFSLQWYAGEPLDYRPVLTEDVFDRLVVALEARGNGR